MPLNLKCYFNIFYLFCSYWLVSLLISLDCLEYKGLKEHNMFFNKLMVNTKLATTIKYMIVIFLNLLF